MFLIIETGATVEVCRRLSPTEPLDCSHHAQRYARAIGYAVDPDVETPAGIGADFDVTIQPTKKPGSVHVWNSAGFYFAQGATE